MPFTGIPTVSGASGAIFNLILKVVSVQLKKKVSSEVHESIKSYKPLKDKELGKTEFSKFSKNIGKKDTWVAVGQAMKFAATVPLGMFDGIVGMFRLLGVFEPILNIINGLFSIFSGTIMKEMAPALMELADTFFSPENIALVQEVGSMVGKALIPVLGVLGIVLLGFFKILLLFKPLLDYLASLNAGQMAALIFVLMVAYSFLYGLLNGGPIVGAIYAGIAGAVLGAVFGAAAFLAEGGIVTSPTLAVIGERGPEAVIPLNQNSGSVSFGGEDSMAQQEAVWATEANGSKLDKIIYLLERSNNKKM